MQAPHNNLDPHNNLNSHMRSIILATELIINSDITFAKFCDELQIHYLEPQKKIPHYAPCFVPDCMYSVTHKHLYKPDTYSCRRHRNPNFIPKTHIKCRELGCFKTIKFNKPGVEYYCPNHTKRS